MKFFFHRVIIIVDFESELKIDKNFKINPIKIKRRNEVFDLRKQEDIFFVYLF